MHCLVTCSVNFWEIIVIGSLSMVVLAFARGDMVFIFSFKIFTFSKETGRYWIYFTVLLYVFDEKIINQ